MSHGDAWEKSLPGSTCKGPETRVWLVSFRISREVRVTGVGASRVGVIGKEDTEMVAVGEEEQIMTG